MELNIVVAKRQPTHLQNLKLMHEIVHIIP